MDKIKVRRHIKSGDLSQPQAYSAGKEDDKQQQVITI